MSARRRPNGSAKGRAAERELARHIHELLGVRMQRQLDQCRGGGYDLSPAQDAAGPAADAMRGWALEVKRYARATPALLAGWWAQARAQAEAAHRRPCLAYREDRGDWRVVISLADLIPGLPDWPGLNYTAELSLPGWCTLVREGMPRESDQEARRGVGERGRYPTTAPGAETPQRGSEANHSGPGGVPRESG